MADKLLIVHGYSDGYMSRNDSFSELVKFLVKNDAYARKNIHFVEYASMDDQSTYEDFADKLDADYEKKIGSGNRMDVLCHSTGALVIRVWLAHRRQLQRERELPLDSPVHRLFMFAPANFGSDLARMGQSFLGKIRCTFFNKNAFRDDRWESGRVILQGLEPASPFQWDLSMKDLHGETYFGPDDESGQLCYPFVFAAANGYTGMEAKILKARNKPGTDGTVRICGTGIHTRKCTLRSTEIGPEFKREAEKKHAVIPFAVFQGFNHGSILNPAESGFEGPHGPGTALMKALGVQTPGQYAQVANAFDAMDEQNYATASDSRYQQFFFKVRDDAGFRCTDYYINFRVEAEDKKLKKDLNEKVDVILKEGVTVHSQDRSMRVFLVELTILDTFLAELTAAQGRLDLTINAQCTSKEVSYEPTTFVVHDATERQDSQPVFLYPNTTTLIEVILNRKQNDKVLKITKRG